MKRGGRGLREFVNFFGSTENIVGKVCATRLLYLAPIQFTAYDTRHVFRELY